MIDVCFDEEVFIVGWSGVDVWKISVLDFLDFVEEVLCVDGVVVYVIFDVFSF